MTKEEAIKIFNTVLLFGKCDCPKEEIEECLKMAIEALEQTRWISVAEKLPESGENILFSTKPGSIFEGRYFDDNTGCQWYSYRDDIFVHNYAVTAWMPLPAPFKPQESEE